jgi:hypothetical protein
MDLLTTYKHNSELQVITVPTLISTLYRSLHGKPSLACCVFTSRSLATASNSDDSSASRTQVLSSQPPMQNLALNRRGQVESSLLLRPTVSRPVSLGIKHPSGAYAQIFITVRQSRVC